VTIVPTKASEGLRDEGRRLGGAVLAAYSQVLFSRSRLVGALLLAATFVDPVVGGVGRAGAVLATCSARLVGFDGEAVRSGVLGYNALLVFAMIGAMLTPSPAFWVLAAVLAAGIVLVHVGLGDALHRHFGLPVMSLPFVFVSWLALAAVPYVRGMGFRTPETAAAATGTGGLSATTVPFPGPELVDHFLRALGAIFFQPNWVAGALVLAALLVFSRIATLHAIAGFAVAVAADQWLFSLPPDFLHTWIGFNFILTAVALGGIFYVPGPRSLVLASLGALLAGWVAVAAARVLQPLGLPILALPLNVVVLGTIAALRLRSADVEPRAVDFVAGSPEDNLNHFRTRVRRFRSAVPITLRLPFRGAWVVTQGNDGDHTHQGRWRHGLDFEVAGRDGERHEGTGEELADWHCWRLPVTAPAAGTVVKVVDGLPDNPVGGLDVENNWGNVVIVQHGPALFSLVAHLSPGTIAVGEGDVVAAGAQLGLVGSSGRAPVPHLHFQLQATPTLGDATLPVEFHGVLVDGRKVESRVLPREGDVVANPTGDAGLAGALALTPGARLRAEVTVDGATRTEELVSTIDALGNRSLVCAARDARLWFGTRDGTFVVYDHVGPRDGALFAMYAALPRVPLTAAPRTAWTDHLDPRRLGTTSWAWVRDLAAALVPPADQAMDYEAHSRGERVEITGRSVSVRGRKAVTTAAVIRRDVGLDAVQVAIGDRRVEVEFT